ncbi:DUF4097 family beta strand repeat-containing protein [Brochothrix campestris]|uniref:DUF4097 domain-containing protein n=1 Tax=Brochothrix campestris FSL F6-1037 TaxID=1265861 RepID=W7CQ90_9LIST|nr:DUF4097 family beta strand repeat-containing protein [Brochothrix campestris]EUJ41779.1 hypothetical protein BCAMP_02830 [Brochothrix campestris FSL F6-1037]
MKKRTMIYSALVVVGLIIAGISFSSGTISAIAWHNHRFETVDYVKETKKVTGIHNVNIAVKSADVVLETGVEAKAEWTADKNHPIKVDVSNGTLNVTAEKGDAMIFGIIETTPTIKITLPKEKLETVNIMNTYGDVSVTDIKAKVSVIQVKSGDLDIAAVKLTDDLTITQTYGDIQIDNSSAKQLRITSESGDIDSTKNAFNEAQISSRYGDVTFKESDLTALTLEASSGDIKVLNSVLAGVSHISNQYGDIKISTKNAVGLTIDTAYGDVKVNGKNYNGSYQKTTTKNNQLTIENKSGDVKVDTN